MAEQHIKMAARLYEIRDTARRLLGSQYRERMDGMGAVLSALAKDKGRNVLSVAIEEGKKATDQMQFLFIMAAAVELTEPTP